MSAQKGPQAPGTYRHCLRKIAEHEADIQELVSGVDEAVYTRDVTFTDGKRRRAVFITSDFFRDRLLMTGWEDAAALLPRTAPAPAPAPSDVRRRARAAG